MIQSPQIIIDTQIPVPEQSQLPANYNKTNRSMTAKGQKRIRNKIQERRNPYELSKAEHKHSHASSSGFPKRRSNRVEASNKIQKERIQTNTQKSNDLVNKANIEESTVIEKTLRLVILSHLLA